MYLTALPVPGHPDIKISFGLSFETLDNAKKGL